MSIPKCKDFSDYNRYPSDANPTTDADMQEYMANQNELMKIVAGILWQPKTNYEVGQEIRSNAMPSGCVAIATNSGVSGEVEPQWNDIGEVTADGSVVWKYQLLDEKVDKVANLSGTINNTILHNATNDTFFAIDGGSGNATDGARLALNGANAENAGTFYLSACNPNGEKTYLVGYPNGVLNWGGNDVERVVSKGENYIRFFGGIQICWDYIQLTGATTKQQFSLPVPFANASYYIGLQQMTNVGATVACGASGDLDTNKFYVTKSTASNVFIRYIAIGRWK